MPCKVKMGLTGVRNRQNNLLIFCFLHDYAQFIATRMTTSIKAKLNKLDI